MFIIRRRETPQHATSAGAVLQHVGWPRGPLETARSRIINSAGLIIIQSPCLIIRKVYTFVNIVRVIITRHRRRKFRLSLRPRRRAVFANVIRVKSIRRSRPCNTYGITARVPATTWLGFRSKIPILYRIKIIPAVRA